MLGSLIAGSLAGLNYGLLALGLVLVYKVNRFINVAHAQMGVFSAIVLAKLVIDFDWPYWAAALVALAIGIGIAMLVELLVVRPLRDRGPTTLLIASVGVAQILIAITYVAALQPNPTKIVADGYPVPFDTTIEVDGFVLRGQHTLALIVSPLVLATIAIVLRRTLAGKLMRATASNRDYAQLCGVPVGLVSSGVWAVAGLLSAATAILAAPGQGSFKGDAFGPSLLLWVLGAAALGGFTRLVPTFLAGLGIGIVEGLLLYLTSDGAKAQALVFVGLLVVLLIRSRRADSGSLLEQVESPATFVIVPARAAHRPLIVLCRPIVWVVGLFIGAIAPFLPPLTSVNQRFILSLTLIYALIALTVTVLTGWAGQISLGQVALVGLGALLSARLTVENWPLPAQILTAGTACAVVAAILGLPALKGRGMTLLVSTLGFGVVAVTYLFRQGSPLAGQNAVAVGTTRVPGFGELDTTRDVYFACLITLILIATGLAALRNTDAGRRITAARDNPAAAASLGISIARARLTAFIVSGFIAGVAGTLWAAAFQAASASMFTAGRSFVILSIATIGGLASIPGAILGAVSVVALPYWTNPLTERFLNDSTGFQLLLAGLGVVTTQLYYPSGMAGWFSERWQVIVNRIARELPDSEAHLSRSVEPSDMADDAASERLPRAKGLPTVRELHSQGRADLSRPGPALSVQQVCLSFGGIQALRDLTLEVAAGETVGLIGANGAGKTTLLNVISGIYTPSAGSVRVAGHDVTRLPAHKRAALGLARSFQDARLFPQMTVLQTVQLGLWRSFPGNTLLSVTGSPLEASTEQRSRAQARELLDAMGLLAWESHPTSALSTGMRRLCDLTLQVASAPTVLLLDEPTAGVAQREVEAFAAVIERIKTQLGCAILIIEHDMPLVMTLSDRIYALESGAVISSGSPESVRNDPQVIASYLGTDNAAIDRSGPGPAARRTPKPVIA